MCIVWQKKYVVKIVRLSRVHTQKNPFQNYEFRYIQQRIDLAKLFYETSSYIEFINLHTTYINATIFYNNPF